MKLSKYIAVFFIASTLVFASVWEVPDSIATIQAAVDTASSGDTIYVKNAFQNLGPVEIIGKKIALLSKNYVINPHDYNISGSAALYDSVYSRPLLKISNSDSTVIKGFLLDKSNRGKGGGIEIDNSSHVALEGLYFRENNLTVSGSVLSIESTVHYQLSDPDAVLLSFNNSSVHIKNSVWKNSSVSCLLETGSNTELFAENLAVFNNDCSSNIYRIGSTSAFFNYITSYFNTAAGQPWLFSSTYVNIENSVLEYSPPLDIAQCDINYSAVPGNYPGQGNLADDPKIDSLNSLPVLMDISPCISAANPDTSGIPRKDLPGNHRPNPEWAPPDMGAFESDRHLMLNTSHRLIIRTGGDDIWGNGSEQYPFASLQAGIDYARDLDTLILEPGEYTGNAEIEGKSLLISSPYLLTNDTAYIDSVILTGDPLIKSSILTLRNIDSLKLSGLSFKNGSGRHFYVNYSLGGAIYCESSSLDLERIKFFDNNVSFSGGGLYASDSYIKMNNISFNHNTAYLGAAFSLSASTAHISELSIENNAASSGGGIYLESGSKLIAYYASFKNNSAINDSLTSQISKPSSISQYGGAIYAINSDIRLHNTLMDGNTSLNKGGALATRGGKTYLLQSTFVDNKTDADSSGIIYMEDLSHPGILVNSIVWNPGETEIEAKNTDMAIANSLITNAGNDILQIGDDTHLDLQNISGANPLLAVNRTLLPGSPCLDAGISTYISDSNYLINYTASDFPGSAPDLGFSGAHPEPAFVLESVETNISNLPDAFELLSAYPNPFNPRTTLSFRLPNSGHTTLSVYDLSGRHMLDLVDQDLIAGNYSLDLLAAEFPSGLYIAMLIQEGFPISSKKLLLVK